MKCQAEQGPSLTHRHGQGGPRCLLGLALDLSSLCSSTTSHVLHRVLPSSVWEAVSCARPSQAATETLTQQGIGAGPGCPPSSVCCNGVVSLSEVFVLSSVQVEERPQGQLSARPHPVHRAESISQGQRDSAPSVVHCPQAAPATFPTPPHWGCHPSQDTERREVTLSQTGTGSQTGALQVMRL